MELKPGQVMQMHCYKHDGKIHRTWDKLIILDETKDYVVCANDKVYITESDGRTHKTKETAIVYLYKKRWFHITAQYKKVGLYYKADIASPFLIDNNIFKYIDYDLDLKVFPDGEYKVLDRNEYKYHRKIMKYSEELDYILKKEMTHLIKMKENNEGPFNKKISEYYYAKYLKMQKYEEYI